MNHTTPQEPKKVFVKLSSGTEDDLIFNNQSLLELGTLYFEKCDFGNAVTRLLTVKNDALQLGLYDNYFKAVTTLMRIHAERLDGHGLERLASEVNNLEDSIPHFERLRSRVEYVQGIYCYYESNFIQAESHFLRAERDAENALDRDDLSVKEVVNITQDLFYARYGLVTISSSMKKFDVTLEQIASLEKQIHEFESTEAARAGGFHAENLDAALLIAKGNIFRRRGEFQKALEMFWKAHSNLKSRKVWSYYYYVLLGLGKTYLNMEDNSRAGIFFDLIRDAVSSLELLALKRNLEEVAQRAQNNVARLVIDRERKIVVEKDKGEVHFERRFILLEILYLLASEPGHVYTKDVLVEKIWKESYNPMIHDSKVYTSISRLRKLIEPDFKRPRYILNERDGYSFNPSVRVEELGNWHREASKNVDALRSPGADAAYLQH